MAKGNQKSYDGGLGGIGIYPRTESIDVGRGIDPEAIQALDNLALNPINRVGDPALGSRNTGHPKERPTNQSRQDYDKQVREQARGVK